MTLEDVKPQPTVRRLDFHLWYSLVGNAGSLLRLHVNGCRVGLYAVADCTSKS